MPRPSIPRKTKGGEVFAPGETVLVHLSDKSLWEPAIVISKNGNVTYVVELQGQKHYCHRDMMKSCSKTFTTGNTGDDTPRVGRPPVLPARQETQLGAVPRTPRHDSPSPNDLTTNEENTEPSGVNTPRRSMRQHRSPQRLAYDRMGSPS